MLLSASNEVHLYVVLATNLHLYSDGEPRDFIAIEIAVRSRGVSVKHILRVRSVI